jgi:hypothetical protein
MTMEGIISTEKQVTAFHINDVVTQKTTKYVR